MRFCSSTPGRDSSYGAARAGQRRASAGSSAGSTRACKHAQGALEHAEEGQEQGRQPHGVQRVPGELRGRRQGAPSLLRMWLCLEDIGSCLCLSQCCSRPQWLARMAVAACALPVYTCRARSRVASSAAQPVKPYTFCPFVCAALALYGRTGCKDSECLCRAPYVWRQIVHLYLQQRRS